MAGQGKTEQGKAGQGRAGQGRGRAGQGRAGHAGHTSMQGRAGHTRMQGRGGHTSMQQGRAWPSSSKPGRLQPAMKHEGVWSHLKSSMSTVMRRSLSAKPSSTVRPVGCSDTL